MHSHLDIELNGKPLTLNDDFSLPIEESSPLFYKTDMFSLPVPIPLEGNRHVVKNMEVPQADMRPTDLEWEPVRIIADGMPFKSGTVRISDGEDIRDALTLNVDAAAQSFDDLIGDLECQDVPLKDKIQVGEKIGNIKVDVNYAYKVRVHYHSDKKDEWDEYPYEDTDETISGVFEPQALGFSFPGICKVTGTKQEAAPGDGKEGSERTYAKGNKVKVPKVLQSFINVTDAYPEKPYCNARIAYMHHGLNDDGTTSDALPEMDKIDSSAREEHYPYWVLDADRPQSGLCFYVLYFLECLFTHLDVSYDLSALTDIEDMKHLCFFTTHHKYYTEVAHGSESQPFFEAETNTQYKRRMELSMGLSIKLTREEWKEMSEEEFNKKLFSDINTWLESRGCGGQFVLNYPQPKSVQDFDYTVDGTKHTIKVGDGDVQEISIEATVKYAKVSANILSMYASSDNFPEASVSDVLDSLEASFGIKFHYDYEQKHVTAYLLRDVFRSQEEPIDFLGTIHDMYKVVDKTSGIRMAYSAESDSKEQRQNVRRGVKDYDTDYDYIDYPEDNTEVGLTYKEIINLPKSQQKENLVTYVDRTTGNTYRWKTSKEALESGEYKISLFQVATFKGIELGDCSERNKENVKEFMSGFAPVPFNDVNYSITEMMVQGDTRKVIQRDGKTYIIERFNQSYEPMLSAFADVDMEHEFVPQYINNALPSAFVDIYLTEQLKLVESYDPSQTDDGNSPLQEIDWGLAIALMQGGGTGMEIQRYDYNYDGMGNSRWRRVPGEYALTSDSMDMQGNTYDYNGDRPDDGGGERFSLKIHAPAPFVYYSDNAGKLHMSKDVTLAGQRVSADSDLTWLLPCNDDVTDAEGKVLKKIRTRGLYDSFMSEYFHILLHGKRLVVEVSATVAQLLDITNHWDRRYRINGLIGWIGKINYDLTCNEGVRNAELEFYAM